MLVCVVKNIMDLAGNCSTENEKRYEKASLASSAFRDIGKSCQCRVKQKTTDHSQHAYTLGTHLHDYVCAEKKMKYFAGGNYLHSLASII